MHPHSGSQQTYEFISDWIDPKFFFSKKDVWHRMGMLGVFGDYVLSCTQGAIAEIGCGESSIYLSHLARKYDREIFHCDLAPDKIINPLTVPGYMLDAKEGPIHPERVHQVGRSTFLMLPSDEMFERGLPPLALAFVDGDHHYEQAAKDFWNFVPRMVDHGFIFLHDTYPPDPTYLCPDSACGDVFRLRQKIEKDPRFDVMTLTRGTAMGVGLTMVRVKPLKREPYHE